MPKYRKPPQEITDEPVFFVKHYWNLFVEWFGKNKDHVLTGVLIVAIVLLGTFAWKRYAATRGNEAWGQLTLAGGIPELESAVARFGSTPAGPFLKLRLADQYVSAGQPDNAIKIYSEVASDKMFPERDRARFSIAMAYETSGKFDEAAKDFTTLAGEKGFWAERAKESMLATPTATTPTGANESTQAAEAAAASSDSQLSAGATDSTLAQPQVQASAASTDSSSVSATTK